MEDAPSQGHPQQQLGIDANGRCNFKDFGKWGCVEWIVRVKGQEAWLVAENKENFGGSGSSMKFLLDFNSQSSTRKVDDTTKMPSSSCL